MMKKSVQTACLVAGGLVTAWAAPVRADSVNFSGSFTPGDNITDVSFIYQSNASVGTDLTGTPQSDFSIATLSDLTSGASDTVDFSSIDSGNRGFYSFPFDYNGDGTSFLVVGLDVSNNIYVAGNGSVGGDPLSDSMITYADLHAAIADPSAAGSSSVLESFLNYYQGSDDTGYVDVGYQGATGSEDLLANSYASDTAYPTEDNDANFSYTQLTGQTDPASVPLPSSALMGGALIGLVAVGTGLRRRRNTAV